MTPNLILTAIVVTLILCAWVHCGLACLDAYLMRRHLPITRAVAFVALTGLMVYSFIRSL